MSTKISFSLLAITGVFLSTEATYAWVSQSNQQVGVANNTSEIQVSSGDIPTNPETVNYDTDKAENNSPNIGNNINSSDTNGVVKFNVTHRNRTIGVANLVEIERTAVVAARNPQEIKFERHNTNYRSLSLANQGNANLPTQQTDVFSSDVAVLGSRTEIKPSSPVEPPEFSIVIPVPPPRTQSIVKVRPVSRLPQFTKIRTIPTVGAIPTVQTSAATAPSNSTVPQPVTRLPQFTKIRTIPTVGAIPTVQPSAATAPSNSTVPTTDSSQVSIYPLLTPVRTTSRFGWRTHPLTGARRFHSGVDLGAPMGAPVVATVSGTIVSAGWNGGYGKAIVIQHDGVQQTLYGHLSEISVQAGQSIEQGTVIGLVGSTGNSTGPHLHFEERVSTADGWVAVDPGAEIQYALENLKRSDPFAQRDLPPGI